MTDFINLGAYLILITAVNMGLTAIIMMLTSSIFYQILRSSKRCK